MTYQTCFEAGAKNTNDAVVNFKGPSIVYSGSRWSQASSLMHVRPPRFRGQTHIQMLSFSNPEPYDIANVQVLVNRPTLCHLVHSDIVRLWRHISAIVSWQCRSVRKDSRRAGKAQLYETPANRRSESPQPDLIRIARLAEVLICCALCIHHGLEVEGRASKNHRTLLTLLELSWLAGSDPSFALTTTSRKQDII